MYDIEVQGNHNFIVESHNHSLKNDISSIIVEGPCVSNCHHLGAEVFSRCLPKIGTYYTLGLSATPKRQDGLSKVFYWWLGPSLYTMIEKRNTPVNIYQIIIKDTSDRKYSREEFMINGKICIAKMINNICNYEPRMNYIVRLITHLVKNPKRQILVLSGRRNHLETLEMNLVKHDISVGFYVGGMKQVELKASEKKQVVLGTYSMSAEGLDIKTLNTLVFISPMTNITQSVGRILRCAHTDITPEVFDLCDDFSTFIRQATTRRRFYQKKEYQVYQKTISYFTDPITSTYRSEFQEYKKHQRKKKKEKKCLI